MANISQKWLDSAYVLVPFTSDYHLRLHATEIARLLHLPQRTVARNLECLSKQHLIISKMEGRNRSFFIDLENPLAESIFTLIETYKEITFSLMFSSLAEIIHELSQHNPVFLFGSYAAWRAKEDSDVDIVIIGKKSKKIQEIIQKSPFTIHPHIVSYDLFIKRLHSGWPLALEIARNHILFGEKEKVIKALITYWKKGR